MGPVVSPQPDALLGQVLHDTYRILRPMGRGGMGVIYVAENVRLPNVRYAVKVLQPRWVQDRDNVEANYARFRREAEIISALRHPNIVGVVDYNRTEQGYPYIVMELLEGEDLETRLDRSGKLPPDEVCDLVEQVGGALQLAHDSGVVHRDLKPANIFLASIPGGWQAKLLDFGISRGDSVQRVTVRDMIIGTPAYMSPEQARGDLSAVDHTTDIFALATIVYRCLTGKRPFDGGDESEVRFQVQFNDPPALVDLAGEVPPELGAVIGRAHAKHKHDRHPRVLDFVSELLGTFGRAPAPPVDALELARTIPREGSASGAPPRTTPPAVGAQPQDEISTKSAPDAAIGPRAPNPTATRATIAERPRPSEASATQRPRWRRLSLAAGVVASLLCIVAGVLLTRLIFGHGGESGPRVRDGGARAIVVAPEARLDGRLLLDHAARPLDAASPDRAATRRPASPRPKTKRPPPKKKLLFNEA